MISLSVSNTGYNIKYIMINLQVVAPGYAAWHYLEEEQSVFVLVLERGRGATLRYASLHPSTASIKQLVHAQWSCTHAVIGFSK